MELMIVIGILWVVPCMLSWEMCERRNRNHWKGLVLALLFGWWAVLGIWLGLKTRNPKTGTLIA